MTSILPDRARWAAIPVAVLTAGGVGLLVAGSYSATRAEYVAGLVLATAGLCLLVLVVLPGVRRPVRLAVALVVGAAAAGLGVWIPRHELAAEFDGHGVRWSVHSLSAGGKDAYSDDEFVETVLGTSIVLANPTSARIVSAVDGHQIATIPADRSDTFSLAHGRLLVVAGRSAGLYTPEGRPVWPAPVRAARGVAAGSGVTVVESGDTASAVADDGSVRWTRRVDDARTVTKRFPRVLQQPASTVGQGSGPPVLPDLAALPSPESRDLWDFADPASGDVVASVRGDVAGSVGGTAVTVTRVGDGDAGGACEMRTRTPPLRRPTSTRLACTFAKPWLQDDTLVLENAPDATAVHFSSGYPDGTSTTLRDVSSLGVGEGAYAGRLSVSAAGITWHDGSLVRGYPGVGYARGWTFTGESDRLDLDVRDHTTVVTAELTRTDPFDPRPGRLSTGDHLCDCDHRVTVLDQDDGTVTGSVRVHEIDSVLPLADGAAVVSADGRIRMIGRRPGGTG